MKDKDKKIENKSDWANFTIGYLHLVELSLKEIIYKKHNDIGNHFTAEQIFIPTLFNLKHAIEVFLKHLSIEFLNKEFFDSSDYSHDIEKLFSRIKKQIPEKRIDEVIKKHDKEKPNEKLDLNGKNLFDELESIINKYHSIKILKNKIEADYEIKDTNNTALKYPLNDLNITLKYSVISKKFNTTDAQEVLVDCFILQKIFWLLKYLFILEQEK